MLRMSSVTVHVLLSNCL